MSENVQIVTIICSCVSTLGTGLLSVLAFFLRERLRTMQRNVLKIELATNSMKDALVKATGDAAFLAGEKSERLNPTSPGPSLLDPSKPAGGNPST